MDDAAAISIDGSKRLEFALRKAASSSEREQRLLGKEANELRDTAQRIRTEANEIEQKLKRLRDEADKVESQSKRLRTASEKACNAAESLVLEATCLSLSRNEAKEAATYCKQTTDHLAAGYASSLGKALLQNDYVSSLNICLEKLVPNVKGCDSPRSEVDVKTCVAPLVQYVETSPSLRSVFVESCHEDDDINGTLTESILGACFRNPNLENLAVEMNSIPSKAFVAPQSSCSLLHLRIKCEDCYTQGEKQAIAAAFGTFASLTSLDLDIYACDLMRAILVQIKQSGNDKIDRLSLTLENDECTPRLWPAIAAIVHANPDFQRLHLAHMSVYAHTIEAFLHVLKRPDNTTNNASPTSLSELSLQDVTMHDDAGERLCRFMRTKTEPGIISSLQKLTMDMCGFDCRVETWVSMLCMQKQGRDESPARLGEAATMQQSTWHPTIGSQITSLSMDNVSASYPGFLNALAKKGHRIRLQELTVSMLHGQDVVALTKCISKIKSLRALDASWVMASPLPIVRRLREHAGNIHSVSVKCYSIDEGDVMTKLARAYGERNQYLDPLLRQTVESVVTDCGETEASKESNKDKALCLPLLQASMHIPSSTSGTVLRSLLRLRETLGDTAPEPNEPKNF